MDDGPQSLLLAPGPACFLGVRYWFGVSPQFPRDDFRQLDASSVNEAVNEVIEREYNRQLDAGDIQPFKTGPRVRIKPGVSLKSDAGRKALEQLERWNAPDIHDKMGKAIGWTTTCFGQVIDPRNGRQTYCSPVVWLAALKDRSTADAVAETLATLDAFQADGPIDVFLEQGYPSAQLLIYEAAELASRTMVAASGILRIEQGNTEGEWEKMARDRYLTPLLDGLRALSLLHGRTTDAPAANTKAETENDHIEVEEFIFKRTRGGFYIRGFGETGNIAGLKGLEHIRLLLMANGREVSPEELAQGRLYTPDLKRNGAEGLSTAWNTAEKAFDDEGQEAIRQEIAGLKEDIEDEIRKGGHQLAVDELVEKLTALEKQVRKDTRPDGKARDIYNKGDALAGTAQKNIKNACKNLEERHGMPAIAKHFLDSVKRDNHKFRYAPEDIPREWNC